MESIERIADNIPAEKPTETVKENDDVIKALYDVGSKISDVIVKLTEMSEKLNPETETETETGTETETETETEKESEE